MDSDYLFDNFLQRPSFRFNEAFNYDNPAALAALYTEDAVLVVPGKPKSSGQAKAIRSDADCEP